MKTMIEPLLPSNQCHYSIRSSGHNTELGLGGREKW
jgi:hypothetical protein